MRQQKSFFITIFTFSANIINLLLVRRFHGNSYVAAKNQTATLLFFCIVRIFLHNNIHMDILPESLIYSNLGKIGMVVFFCHHHLKFYTLASLGQDDILQFFLCFRYFTPRQSASMNCGIFERILPFSAEMGFMP